MIVEFKDIDKLSPADFEIFVRDLFVASGWTDAEITKVGREFKHGDGGVDIFASKGKRRFAIEVKQRNISTNVDVSALNQLVTGANLANVKNKILVTNSYYTSEVQARALRLGVELIDRDALQNLWLIKHSEIGRDIKPRKYQQIVIDESIDKYLAGKNKILIEMATGLGKTYTVAHLIKSLIQQNDSKVKILFIAHQVEILLQSVTAFKNVLGIGNYSFSACFGGSVPEDTDFVFASFDSLYSHIEEIKQLHFDFVIVDEAHHTPARTYSQVVTSFSPKFLIGLTATPYRNDNQSVTDFFGGPEGHVGKYDLSWALKNKKLAFPKYLVLLDDLDQSKIDQLESGLSVSDLDERLFLHKKDEEVVRIIQKTVREQNIDNVKGIVFCKGIKHMRYLIKFFDLGTATMVHSKMLDAERRANIRKFREGGFKYILVCDLFNEGIDIPETNLLVFMRYTGSRTIWLQQLGRGLRKTPNKDYVHVLDFVGSLQRLNDVKRLVKDVESKKRDLDDGYDDSGSHFDSELHDISIEVSYSEEAARVLELLENLKYQLNSRSVLLDKIISYRDLHNCVPSVENVESEIEDVWCDQISTHFGSYSKYLIAAFGYDPNIEKFFESVDEYINFYEKSFGVYPSCKAIANNFQHKQLYVLDENDVEDLMIVRGVEHYKEGSQSGVYKSDVEIDKYFDDFIDEAFSEDLGEGFCKYLDKYLPIVTKRSDLKLIEPDDYSEIIRKYKSPSIFLKKITDKSHGR